MNSAAKNKRSVAAIVVVVVLVAAVVVLYFHRSRGGDEKVFSLEVTKIEPAPLGDSDVPPDQSLKADEYSNKGMPSLDRPWNPSDYLTCINVLGSCAENNIYSLPRYKSANSGAIFNRIVSVENFSQLEDKTRLIDVRIREVSEYIVNLNGVFVVYVKAGFRGKPFDSEVVEIMARLLNLNLIKAQLSDEALASTAKEDPSYALRKEGREAMKAGLFQIMMGAIRALTEHQYYRDSELIRLAGYIKDFAPPLMAEMTPDAKAQLITRIREIIQQEKKPGLKNALSELLDEVEKQPE